MHAADGTDPAVSAGGEHVLRSIDRKLTVLLWIEAVIAGMLAVCGALGAGVALALTARRRRVDARRDRP